MLCLRRTALLLILLAWGSFNDSEPKTQSPDPLASRPGPEHSRKDPAKVEAPGLHNVYRIMERLYSGSSPDGEAGFQSLKKLGIRTVISVDGLRPDVITARKYGLRYVQIPFGYDGIPREKVLQLAKAVRDLPGPVYVHCHHGMHRGPAAAAAIHLCLDQRCTVAQAIAEMHRAGTDPHYTGLYAVPKTLRRPSPKDLDEVPADFPEVATVPDLARLMVEIDARSDNLKQIQAAGWKTPPDHADLDPPHEALQLVEQFREVGRLAKVKERPEDFRRRRGEAEKFATTLETILRVNKDNREINRVDANDVFRKLASTCTQCHARYRDVHR